MAKAGGVSLLLDKEGKVISLIGKRKKGPRDVGPLPFPKVAEAQRFELWLGRNPTIGFQDRPLQPLGYASELVVHR